MCTVYTNKVTFTQLVRYLLFHKSHFVNMYNELYETLSIPHLTKYYLIIINQQLYFII